MIWDQRYTSDAYVYGTEPNEFLVETIRGLNGGGRALCLGEGEGRNAVFLAGRGYEVHAVDASAVGLAKAERRTSAVRGCIAGFSVFIFGADPEERVVGDLP